MPVILAVNWLTILIRGAIALVLGVLMVLWHNLSLYEISLIFFGYVMIDGLANLAGAVTAIQARQRWGLLMAEAVASLAAGLAIVALPNVPLLGFVYIIAAWGLVTGCVELFSAARLHRHGRGAWLLALSGVVSISLGLIMVTLALSGTSSIAVWLGAYALIFGVLMVTLAILLGPTGNAGLRPVSPRA